MNEKAKGFPYHPYKLIVYFLLLGISSLFLILTIAYIFTSIKNDFEAFRLPVLFHLNSLVIVLCSYFIHQSYKSILLSNEKGYENGIVKTLIFGTGFLIFQVIGWGQLFNSGMQFSNNLSAAYLYAISGFHALHVVAGIVPLVITFYRIKKRQSDPVKSVVFESDPVNILKVKLMATYWHFIDILWIFLYLFFLVNIFLL